MTILMGSNKLNLCFEKIPFCFSHWTFDTGFLSKFQLSDIYLAGIITTVSQQEESHK